MLLLAFKRPGRSSVLGPVQAIEFRGNELFIGGGTKAEASYIGGGWTFENERWTYAECQAQVVVRLEDHSGSVGKIVGPRPSLKLRDRFIFAGRERVATLLPGRARWQGVGSQQSWPIVRVLPYFPGDAT
jgi:hypothetical protein